MRATKTRPGRFGPGDWVTFWYGTRMVFARVVEARGPLGVNHRHLYRICLLRDNDEPDLFELPEDDLEPVNQPPREAMMKYLQAGGLVAILRSNLAGGKNQPKVWLTYTSEGDLTHTFAAERGTVGGMAGPFFALYQDKVFAGKEEEIITFLTGFGLTRQEADDVIATVGTAP